MTRVDDSRPMTAFQLWQLATISARSTPHAVAICGSEENLTYGELESVSNQLARHLRSKGIGPRNRVGILLPKSARAVAVMHGIMKTGAAYVPIDRKAPMRRAAYIVEDCQLEYVVTTSSAWAKLKRELGHGTVRALLVDQDADGAADADGWVHVIGQSPSPVNWPVGTEVSPAYILYTSGSTGRPKGVVISHRNALAFVEWAGDAFGIDAGDRVANHAPHHFDLSVLDLYCALRGGAEAHLVPERVAPFATALADWISDSEITVWYSVPSALIRLLKQGGLARFDYPHLRTVLFAGEVFPTKYLADVMEQFPRASFHNLYGPTETNVITWQPVPRPLPAEWDQVPLGAACENTDIFVVRDDGGVAEPGDEGELWSTGPTTMLGYWNRPRQSERVLVPDLRVGGAHHTVTYRTGDMVRLEPDGRLTFLGRRDHMVKVRGYRVELGEVERVLVRHEGVAEAIVITEPDDDFGTRLLAFVVPAQGAELTLEQLKSYCLGQLPRYAVPGAWAFLDELPRTSTGKADRVALSEMQSPA